MALPIIDPSLINSLLAANTLSTVVVPTTAASVLPIIPPVPIVPGILPIHHAKAKSPIPVNVGHNKAIAFKLDDFNDVVGGIVADDDGNANDAAPFIAIPIAPEGNLKAGKEPPFFGGKGNCCKPTPSCHAYVKWMLDMTNEDTWESPEQRSEANSHVECCLRQYRASCDDSMSSNTIVWRDPSKYCSPGNSDIPPEVPDAENPETPPVEDTSIDEPRHDGPLNISK